MHNDNLNVPFGGNVHTPTEMVALRRSAGLSQQALAERAKCSIGMIALFERGYTTRKPSAVLARVLTVLAEESES